VIEGHTIPEDCDPAMFRWTRTHEVLDPHTLSLALSLYFLLSHTLSRSLSLCRSLAPTKWVGVSVEVRVRVRVIGLGLGSGLGLGLGLGLG